MNTGCYRFMVGNTECFAVADGTAVYPNPARVLFLNAPQEELSKTLLAHNIELDQWIGWNSSFNCLAVRTGGHLVLVDTGYGNVDFSPSAGKLLQNLRSLDIAPSHIDTVILTHGHRDHLYGVTDDATEKPVFAKAQHIMWRPEWDFWNSEAGLDHDDGDAARKLSALGDQLELVDGEMEIVPGIRVIPAPGHTPGHMVVAIESENERFLHLVDSVGHPIHLQHPDWVMRVDMDPELAVRTRRQLLARAANEGACILAYHFDFPGLGYVHAESESWKWQPMKAVES